jgi:hypothetical protein
VEEKKKPQNREKERATQDRLTNQEERRQGLQKREKERETQGPTNKPKRIRSREEGDR